MEQLAAARQLVALLKERKLVMTTAESCTGGLIAAAIVSVPGASACFGEGYITYSNAAKQKLLGVKEETLRQYTVVSAAVAEEMAKGGAEAAGCDLCISVTGVAGPDTEEGNPVGLVYIGLYYQGITVSKELHLEGSRDEIRRQAVKSALSWTLFYIVIK